MAVERYGINVASLPRWLVRPVRRPPGSVPIVSWVGVPGVRVLGSEEHSRIFEIVSSKIPRDTWGSIDWLGVEPGTLVARFGIDDPMLGAWIRDATEGKNSFVLVWQSTGLPSLEVKGAVISDRWDDLVVRVVDDFMVGSWDHEVWRIDLLLA